jgi:hypothetical protein
VGHAVGAAKADVTSKPTGVALTTWIPDSIFFVLYLGNVSKANDSPTSLQKGPLNALVIVMQRRPRTSSTLPVCPVGRRM